MHRTVVVSVLGLVGCLAVAPVAAQDREWIVAPYIWGADTSLDLLVRDEPVFGGDLDFSDLVDKLDAAVQLHIETRKHTLGFLFDLTYLETSDSFVSPANPPLPGTTTLATDADLTILEAGAFFRSSGEAYGVDVLLGIRAMDVDISIAITPPSPLNSATVRGSESLTDGFVGLRYVTPFGESWLLSLRGDVGTGDSDLSYNLSALLGYRFGENDRYSVLAGYRHFALEFDDSSDDVRVQTELSMSGPQVGFAFRF